LKNVEFVMKVSY